MIVWQNESKLYRSAWKTGIVPPSWKIFKHLKPIGKAFLGMLYNFLEYSSHSHARLTVTSQTLETRALLVQICFDLTIYPRHQVFCSLLQVSFIELNLQLLTSPRFLFYAIDFPKNKNIGILLYFCFSLRASPNLQSKGVVYT